MIGYPVQLYFGNYLKNNQAKSMRRTLKLHLPLLAHYNWQKPQLDSTKLKLSVISLSFIPCPQSNLYTDRYNMLLKIRGGPSGGPWTRSTGVVHGPGSTFCIHPKYLHLSIEL